MRGILVFLVPAVLFVPYPAPAADDPPQMKFNDVREDYVVVIDANFPKGAEEVIEAVKKTTDKPIRYVFDTHHHGDHAYGNAVFAAAGAGVIAQANCARLLRVNGP